MLADCGGREALSPAQPQLKQRSVPVSVPRCHPWGCRDRPLAAPPSWHRELGACWTAALQQCVFSGHPLVQDWRGKTLDPAAQTMSRRSREWNVLLCVPACPRGAGRWLPTPWASLAQESLGTELVSKELGQNAKAVRRGVLGRLRVGRAPKPRSPQAAVLGPGGLGLGLLKPEQRLLEQRSRLWDPMGEGWRDCERLLGRGDGAENLTPSCMPFLSSWAGDVSQCHRSLVRGLWLWRVIGWRPFFCFFAETKCEQIIFIRAESWGRFSSVSSS